MIIYFSTTRQLSLSLMFTYHFFYLSLKQKTKCDVFGHAQIYFKILPRTFCHRRAHEYKVVFFTLKSYTMKWPNG